MHFVLFFCGSFALAGDSPEEKQPAESQVQNIPFGPVMDGDEADQVKPIKVLDGAKWMMRVKAAISEENFRTRSLPVAAGSDFSQYDRYLLRRELTSGGIFDTLRLPTTVSLFTADKNKIICVLKEREKSSGSSDMLYFNLDLDWQNLKFQGALKHWPVKIDVVQQGRLKAGLTLLHGHEKPPWKLLLSTDGSRLVSCSDDASIRLWDLECYRTRQLPNQIADRENPTFASEIAKFPGPEVPTGEKTNRDDIVAMSSNGRWMALALKNKVSLRSLDDGREVVSWNLEIPESRRIRSIQFNPSGRTLACFLDDVGNSDRPMLRFILLSLIDYTECRFDGTRAVVDGHVTQDSQFAVTWDGTSEVLLWNSNRRNDFEVLKVTDQSVVDVAVSPSSDVLISADSGGAMKFWRIDNRTQLETSHAYKQRRTLHGSTSKCQTTDEHKRRLPEGMGSAGLLSCELKIPSGKKKALGESILPPRWGSWHLNDAYQRLAPWLLAAAALRLIATVYRVPIMDFYGSTFVLLTPRDSVHLDNRAR